MVSKINFERFWSRLSLTEICEGLGLLSNIKPNVSSLSRMLSCHFYKLMFSCIITHCSPDLISQIYTALHGIHTSLFQFPTPLSCQFHVFSNSSFQRFMVTALKHMVLVYDVSVSVKEGLALVSDCKPEVSWSRSHINLHPCCYGSFLLS